MKVSEVVNRHQQDIHLQLTHWTLKVLAASRSLKATTMYQQCGLSDSAISIQPLNMPMILYCM